MSTPKSIGEQIIKIEKSDEWKRIEDGDTMSIRAYFDKLDKSEIREALIKEQHGLCAYCMRRIKNDDSMTVEHHRPIKHKQLALEYQNMLGCCDGGRKTGNGRGCLCCDAAKGDSEITISPWDKELTERIRYSKNGEIRVYPADKKLQHDIDDVLRLNGIRDKDGNIKCDTATQVVAGRRNTYDNYAKLMKRMDRRYGKRNVEKEIKKMISNIENSEQYLEYAGVILYFLKRRIRNTA